MNPLSLTIAIGVVAAGVADAAVPRAAITHRRPQLRAVRLRPARDSIQVVFALDRPARYKSTRTTQPPKIVIELADTVISPVMPRREFLSEHSALIRVLLVRSPAGARAVLDLGASGPHSIYFVAASNQLVVDIKTVGRPAVAQARPATPVRAPATLPEARPAAPQIPPAELAAASTSVKIPWVPRRPDITSYTADWALPDGVRVSGFRQREPSDGSPASEPTLAYLSYDSDNLYVGFICRDRSGKVRTHLTPREDISGDDLVTVYLDTFHDGQHAYVFASNPSGVQQDGVIDEGDDPNYEIDTLWYSEGRLTRDGFVVLIAIPFKSLRFSSAPVQTWRIALGRTIAHRGESTFWPYISTKDHGFVRQMGALQGLELISPSHNVQLTPYGTYSQADLRDPQSGAATKHESRRTGLDAKVVVKNAVTIDAAVNPDFSEVESNEPQVAVNQRFEVFFPEKRPFFTENATMFATPINIFFSRRIADPEFGVKVTTRSAKWVFGALAADDRAVQPDETGGWLGPKAAVGVVRVERLFGDRAKVGVLATERQTGRSSNAVASVDGVLNVAGSWSLSGQALHSDDMTSGRRSIGDAVSAAISRSGSHFNYLGTYRDVASGLRVPLGYVPRVDVRVTEHYASYVWRPDEAGVWAFGPSVTAAADWDHAGRLQDKWASGDFALFVAGQFEAHAARSESYEVYADVPFQKRATSVSLSTNTPAWLSIWGTYSWGTGINYSPAADVPPFFGRSTSAYASVAIRPASRLRFEQLYLHERLDTIPGMLSSASRRVFTTHIVRWKANLQISKALSVRGIADFNQLASDRSLFSTPASSQLTGDLLLTYLLHPGTAVYIGFNNRYDDSEVDAHSHGLRLPTSPAGRQVFAKVSYLLRF